MSEFMQPQIQFGKYYVVETVEGSEVIPFHVCGPAETNADLALYCSGKAYEPDEKPELLDGFVCRLSASGYLDCTDWQGFDTEQECKDSLAEMYDCEF